MKKLSKHSSLFFLLALFVNTPVKASSLMVFTAASSGGAEMENTAQLEAKFETVERKAVSQPDAWKAYQQVSAAAPEWTTNNLHNRYRSLAISLVLKAAMACSPDALRLIERNDVVEFRILRSSLVSACRNDK